MSTTEQKPGRTGITLFDAPDGAPLLHETDMMSMPTMDPPAPEQMMEWATSGGHLVKALFRQENNGMSLVWSRFAPGYPLPRHSHSADCLYYVVAGEARMGARTVPAGAGFFVPAGAPYAYSAGPDGIEILEFRNVGSFDMQITESLDRWDRIVDEVRDNKTAWDESPAS
jgi:quercetin dioxygenase-like cupin family protein